MHITDNTSVAAWDRMQDCHECDTAAELKLSDAGSALPRLSDASSALPHKGIPEAILDGNSWAF